MIKTTFKVGDRVRAFGVDGTVIEVGTRYLEVSFYFENGTKQEGSFLLDGRIFDWHAVPSLELIERPKRTVKKKLYVAISPRVTQSITRSAHGTSYAYEERRHAEGLDNYQIVEVEIEVEE